MISFINGKVSIKHPTFVVVNCGGIGYKIHVSLNTYSAIEKAEEVLLYITEVPRIENQHFAGTELYGFADEQERELFEHLISVSGVGAATARIMLSTYKTDEILHAIHNEDVVFIQSIKGIGPKIARRIILELKDKTWRVGTSERKILTGINNNLKEEALSALLALGFSRGAAEKAITQAATHSHNSNNVEMLIKEALKLL